MLPRRRDSTGAPAVLFWLYKQLLQVCPKCWRTCLGQFNAGCTQLACSLTCWSVKVFKSNPSPGDAARFPEAVEVRTARGGGMTPSLLPAKSLSIWLVLLKPYWPLKPLQQIPPAFPILFQDHNLLCLFVLLTAGGLGSYLWAIFRLRLAWWWRKENLGEA